MKNRFPQTVLVVGGRGFLGGFMVAALQQAGWHVRTLARPQGRTLTEHEVAGDLSRMLHESDWEDALEGVDVVVNAAGILREEGRQTFEDIHVRAPLALAQASAKKGVRFVQVSALGHPDDGGFIESKHRFDEALLALPMEAIVLRPSIVYSPQGSYGGTSLLRALAAFPGRHLLPGDGRWQFNPVSAEDLAEVVVAACSRGEKGIYDVGSEQALSLQHYQAAWRQWLKIPGQGSWNVPECLVRAQVRVFHWLGKGPVNQTIWKMLQRGNQTSPGASERLSRGLGVRVRSLGEVLGQRPSQTQDRWAAQLYFLAPWLKWSMVFLWAASGLIGLLTPAGDILALVHGSPLEQAYPVELARLTGLLDIVLAAGLAWSTRPRWAVLAMLGCATAYLVGFGIALPQTAWDPLGGLIKNVAILPALAVLWVLVDRR